jgi:ankyrin repeat protein
VFSNSSEICPALILAAKHGHISLVRWFLDSRALVDGPDPSIATPLIHAAKSGEVEICRLLLERGASIGNVSRKFKSTAYDAAATPWLGQFIQ